jgi:TRAP-type C4-dicarboxylate transport system substrate-binding protein
MNLFQRTLLSAAALGVAAALGAAPSAPAQAMELIHGSWPPAVVYMNRVTLPNAFKAIEDETKGEIKWKLVAGGQLANPKESFQATTDGLIHGALGLSTYVPNAVPSLNTIYSTILFDSDVVPATGAAVETLTLECPSCLAEFKKINIVPLSGWTSSNYYLACREPIKSVEDLKGKRVRGTGGNAVLWEVAGAVPVSATLPEAVTLLQRGGLDCQHGIHGWLKTFGYGDFAKFVTDYPLGLTGPAIGLMLNRTAWEKMSGPQKTAHLKQSAYISAAQALGEFTVDNEKHLQDVIANKGVQMVAAQAAGFKALTEKFDEIQRKNNIASAEKFGVSNPGAIIDTYNKNYKKWEGLTKDLNRDISKFTELMWTEIYSKVDVDKF